MAALLAPPRRPHHLSREPAAGREVAGKVKKSGDEAEDAASGMLVEGSRSRLTPCRASKVSMRRAAPVSTAKTGKIRCLSLATSGSLASRRLGHRAPSPASWPTRQTQEGGSSSAERMTAYPLACKTSVYAIPDGTTAAGAP
ncbi:hypothetical protein RJ55_04471 [Drechmeria coniospora]|nr:hypothetical protein RJ55_04471 [Drechmeria coniospora]